MSGERREGMVAARGMPYGNTKEVHVMSPLKIRLCLALYCAVYPLDEFVSSPALTEALDWARRNGLSEVADGQLRGTARNTEYVKRLRLLSLPAIWNEETP